MTLVGRWLLAINLEKQQLLLTAADADGIAIPGAQPVTLASRSGAIKGASPDGEQLQPGLFAASSHVADNITDALSMASSYSSPMHLQAHAVPSGAEQHLHGREPHALLVDDMKSFEVSHLPALMTRHLNGCCLHRTASAQAICCELLLQIIVPVSCLKVGS